MQTKLFLENTCTRVMAILTTHVANNSFCALTDWYPSLLSFIRFVFEQIVLNSVVYKGFFACAYFPQFLQKVQNFLKIIFYNNL